MPTIETITRYVIAPSTSINAFKLHKLLYYAFAWHYVWDGELLFNNRIEAWAGGPVIPDIYKYHEGKYYCKLSMIPEADSDWIPENQIESINSVIKHYGHRKTNWLTELVKREKPWKKTREKAKVLAGEKSNEKIPIELISEYYNSLNDSQSNKMNEDLKDALNEYLDSIGIDNSDLIYIEDYEEIFRTLTCRQLGWKW